METKNNLQSKWEEIINRYTTKHYEHLTLSSIGQILLLTSRNCGSNSRNNLKVEDVMTCLCNSDRSKVASAHNPPYVATF